MKRTIEVKLTNFQFIPNRVEIENGESVRWTVLDNKPPYESRVYVDDERFFVIAVVEMDVESGNLRRGDTFEIKFEEPGVFKVKCWNFPRLEMTVKVRSIHENQFVRILPEKSLQNSRGKDLQSVEQSPAASKDIDPIEAFMSSFQLKDFSDEGNLFVRSVVESLALQPRDQKAIEEDAISVNSKSPGESSKKDKEEDEKGETTKENGSVVDWNQHRSVDFLTLVEEVRAANAQNGNHTGVLVLEKDIRGDTPSKKIFSTWEECLQFSMGQKTRTADLGEVEKENVEEDARKSLQFLQRRNLHVALLITSKVFKLKRLSLIDIKEILLNVLLAATLLLASYNLSLIHI
eukprot:TRINITY_DN20075_c0_g1_i1.p1 TRINITY_DN20075_c0_g1~~TRINITY_DN20075_c0_g1_i1.p1  ORF type:complete len:348 (+),score=73.70 TRINITY_DN20075_c0_g1_i1:108-1151(+)